MVEEVSDYTSSSSTALCAVSYNKTSAFLNPFWLVDKAKSDYRYTAFSTITLQKIPQLDSLWVWKSSVKSTLLDVSK